MQNIIVERPYRFIPPLRWNWLPRFLLHTARIHSVYNRFAEGVVSHECRHVERLRESLRAGHGIVIAPNHSRTADPPALGWLCEEVPCLFYGMASWHLFHRSWISHWVLRAVGAFSVNREGIDRQAIDAAIDVLVKAERPLVIFPEGATSRTNDHLHPLLDGVACIARVAAKRRARSESPGKVVVHPVAIKYHLIGNVDELCKKKLCEIERRLFRQPQLHLPLPDRLAKIGKALLDLKELKYLGQSSSGPLDERLPRLIEHLLAPLEAEWLGGQQSGPPLLRVRRVRSRILPQMAAGQVTAEERDRRWSQLRDLYLAQQLATYVPDYLSNPSVDRIFELTEKFEEDLTDVVRGHPPLHCVLDVGEPIEVGTNRYRGEGVDPLLAELSRRLQSMLQELACESRAYGPVTPATEGLEGEPSQKQG